MLKSRSAVWRLGMAGGLAVGALMLIVTLTVLAANSIVWQAASTGLPNSGLIRDVAFGDFDNDGKSDLIAVGTNGVVVYKGDGAGNWNGTGFSTGLPVAGQYGHVIVADFNNDGKLDIAASQSSVGAVGAWVGNGAGTWTAWTGLPTGTYEGLAFADVNHDGWKDLIVAGGAPVYPGILVFQNAFASFSQTTSITTTGQYYDLAAAYVDGDTYIDIAAAAQAATGGLKFWRGNFGTWTATNTGLTTTNTFRGVVLDDVDLDGKPELIASRFSPPSASGGGLFIYKYNTGTSSWSLAPNQIPLTNSYYKLRLNDLNNDGWLDLIAGGGSTALSPGLFTYLGSATGFISVTPPITSGSFDRPDVGDLNRDGLLDIAAAGLGSSGVGAWADVGVRDPIGAWTPLVSPQVTGVMNALGYGDFNRDGDLDVVMSRDIGAGLVAYLGDGGNSWASCNITMTPGAQTGNWQDVAVGVWGNISSIEPDVIAASGSGGGIRYFGHSGGCTYWYDFSLVPTGSYRGLSVADMDNDFAYDIVAAPSDGTDGLRVWEGPNHTQMPNPTSVGTYYDTALGDFNNDGKLDIVAAGDTNGVQAFQQVSLRSFISHSIVTSGTYQAIAVGDFNNDGKLDVVAGANGTSNGVDVWLGDGTFTTWTQWPSPDTTHQFFDVAVGDVNHDGWLDILAGGENIGPQVWLGDGAGGWTLSTNNLPTTGSYFRSQFGHIDHDGNLDILGTTQGGGLKLWAAAEAAPPTINNFQPGGWISTTQTPTVTASALDTGAGLNVASGQYRFSTNGGGSWSSLLPATISGVDGTTSTQSISAASVAFNQDSATQNVLEFRAMDMVGNIGTAQAIVKIDTISPTAPSTIGSSSHVVNVWSNNPTLNINWSGATDATSGVYGYSVLIDHNPSSLPGTAVNVFATSYITSPLSEGNWYAHVRTRDVAGNWSPDAIHAGPFKIDLTPPTNPTLFGGSHTPSVWNNDPTVLVTWSGATDSGGSGVAGYSIQWDNSSGGVPDQIQDTAGTSDTSGVLATASNHWFHVRTRDVAGNWAVGAANRGPFYIDTTPPSSSVYSPLTSNSASFTVFWSGSDAHSGLANYDVQYRDKTTNGSWTTWKSATTSTSSTFSGVSGHIYEFRSRARDNVGNLEAYPGTADLTTEIRTFDLMVKNPGIEVNQAVQDLNNSVVLIANKRTFVRCYVNSSSGSISAVPARLYVYRGATYMGALSPANSGGSITVKSSPARSQLNDAYYFDVPTGWLNSGSVTFQCQINTPQKYGDSNASNNSRSVTVNFSKSPAMNILMVDANYWYGGVVRHVRSIDRTRLAAWLRAAYPINTLNVWYGYMDPPYDSLPDVDDLNDDLAWNQSKKVLGAGEDPWTRYYGQVIQVDDNTFMRGKARDIPDTVASGPTGPTGGWDPDGQSFGDWYGGHELGHTYGRYHAEYCGAQDGASYPYTGGRISPTTGEWTNTTLYGLDWSLSTPLVIPPTWTDVMTYCANEWISDFTYEGIWARMVAEKPVLKAQIQAYKAQGVEYLALFGHIITSTNTVTLSTFYRVPDAFDIFGRDISGTYHIKLLGAADAVLADYNFSPRGGLETDDPVAAITEYVPWITGTQKIVIASPTQALITRTVSAHTPTIAFIAPSGGVTLTGTTVNASWTASDADNDPLTFNIDYSRDGGLTWSPLSGKLTTTTATLNLDLLPGTTQGKFRVWVSDGVNTAFAETTGTFNVANKAPEITSVSPISGSTYVVSQTIIFEASTFDPEDGPLADSQLQWSSDLDGALGTGTQLALDTLSIGTHTITLTATDSNLVTSTTTVTVIVGPEPIDNGMTPGLFLPLVLKS
ncbi:MAG: VCBS repeat-containing protein [Anaerolineae bacterium]